MITPNTRYRFIKDTQVAFGITIKAGTDFMTDGSSQYNNVADSGKTASVYALHNWLEDGRIEKVGRFLPRNGEMFFRLNSQGDVVEQRWLGSAKAKKMHQFGNVFETREQAEKIKSMLQELLTNVLFDNEDTKDHA